MYLCRCGKHTNYGPLCINCALDSNFDEGVEELEELDKAVEKILKEEELLQED